MNDLSRAKILIQSGRLPAVRRWAEMLEGLGSALWLSSADVPRRDRPDLIVTDFEEVNDDEAGVVRIGGNAQADVHLPCDVTARELQLACRLLAQIVRLRRHQRSEAELRRRLAADALTDPLTGLPNRRAWDQAVEQRLAAATSLRRLCLAIFDLDHFKRINDAHGHAVGDEVLRVSGRAVRDGLRQDDFMARLGGDEFGLLLWVADADTAATVVDRVRAAVPCRLANSTPQIVAASAGYSVAPSDVTPPYTPSPQALYAAADAALHKAKRQGRDRTVGG